MNPLLIAPGLSAATTAVRSGLATATAGLSSGIQNGADFQRYAAALQLGGGVDVNQLVGLKSGDLQGKISSLSPSQQVTLAQQLMGSTVGVVNAGGQVIEGSAEKLQIEGGMPVFQVAGQSYTLGQLVAVMKTPNS